MPKINQNVVKSAGTWKQPRGAGSADTDPKTVAQHNRDMARVERLHQRGQK